MERYYHAAKVSEVDGIVTVSVGFGEPEQNDKIVPDALAALARLEIKGGKGIHFNGPASIPAALALGHAVAHLFGYVAWFDPKLGRYVVAISHTPSPRPGDLLPTQP